MKNYQLTMEDGVITWIENTDENGNPVEGILSLPKEATALGLDAWVFLGCGADAIIVDEENPVFSAAHNCLLSKDGKTLVKVCKNSDVSQLPSLRTIGRDAFNDLHEERDEFVFRIPEGVTAIDYRAFAMNAKKARIIVPSSVRIVDELAFMIHGDSTHIVFEGDTELKIGAFGTEAEAKDSENELYRSMPSIMFPQTEKITVSCPSDSNVAAYCKRYGIKMI